MMTNPCIEAQLSVLSTRITYVDAHVQTPMDDWVCIIRIRTACPRQQPAQRRALLDSWMADRRVEPRSRAVREAPCCRYCRLTQSRQLQHRPNKSQSLGSERCLADAMRCLPPLPLLCIATISPQCAACKATPSCLSCRF